jgi:class 3 adenylate cyclase/CheY-like chemotaxis protein
LIEDSDIFADMISGFLDAPEYSIERAVNGLEGIKKVYSFQPHLIITDVEMPVFKGYQVTRFLKTRKNTKNIPVIILTALNESKDKFWADQAGADIYFEKSPDNLSSLGDAVSKALFSSAEIDFLAIERESRKVNDNSITEIVNNMLDNKLLQTTVIGLLSKLSGKVHSIETVVKGIFELLHTICEAEISSIMIRGADRTLYCYTYNPAGFSKEIADNFIDITASDFNKIFEGFKYTVNNTIDFLCPGTNKKQISSYINIPLKAAGENFATLHIANSLYEYFSPSILENINVFAGAASPVISSALSMHELSALQKNTRTAFARYVPADVMDEIINETNKKTYASENRNVTVLFSDIRDFTYISEHTNAQVVVDFLNNYFANMGSQIISEGGHIDKFIGDAIMAIFGAFHNQENSPQNAIRAALKMLYVQEKIDLFEGKPALNGIKTGIGINYGECILGNIGFQNKMDYTVIGDTVNMASRTESLTKVYKHPLLVTEYVYELTKDNYLFRKVDNVRVKGKKKPVGLYAVYSGFNGTDGNKLRSGEILDLPVVDTLLVTRDTLVNYNKGMHIFYMREWKLAQDYFKKSIEADNNDYLSKIYLERSIEYESNPPPEDWDGIITLSEK